MDYSVFRHLLDNANDFSHNATNVESEVARLQLQSDSHTIVPDSGGRINRDMWISLKTVSHFNLGTSLELMLKLLLLLDDVPFEHKHKLVYLFDQLPEDKQTKLQISFSNLLGQSKGITLVGFKNTKSAEVPQSPENRPLSKFRDFLEYFDEDVRLWEKRFSYEDIENDEWRHYLSDITVFTKLVHEVTGGIHRGSQRAA